MFRSTLFVLLLSVGIGGPVLARDITGSVAYRERIALPPGTELLVALSGPFGPVGELRATPEGQVPLPFSIATEEIGPLTLRVALFSGGAQIWLTAEIPVPEGDTNVDLGALNLQRHVPLGLCLDDEVRRPADRCGLCRRRGAVARGLAGGRVGTRSGCLGREVRRRGWERLLVKGQPRRGDAGGEDLPECVPVIAPTLPLVARGNEPGWVVTLAHEGVVYSGQDGTKRELPLPAATEVDGSIVFDSGEGLVIRVTDSPLPRHHDRDAPPLCR
jgi:hypothetical protein